MQQLSDQQLLALIQQGNHQAFAELVERHTTNYYKLAYRFTNNTHQAEDVVQDAFLKLWERPHLWDQTKKTRFTTWFYQVIINQCLDLKKSKSTYQIESLDEHNIYSERLTDEDMLVHIEMQLQLEYLINDLPNRQRIALNLCFLEDLSNQEAADIMNLSLKALQSLIMRGKTNIKNKLNGNKS